METFIHYRGTLHESGRLEDLIRAVRKRCEERGWEFLLVDNYQRLGKGICFQTHPDAQWVYFIFDAGGRLDYRTKTGQIPLEAHREICRMLEWLKGEYVPDLLVADERGVWRGAEVPQSVAAAAGRRLSPWRRWASVLRGWWATPASGGERNPRARCQVCGAPLTRTLPVAGSPRGPQRLCLACLRKARTS
jgi:hypothetical protein